MRPGLDPDHRGVMVPLAAIVLVLLTAGVVGATDSRDTTVVGTAQPAGVTPPRVVPPPASLPGGVVKAVRGPRIFDDGRFLVAYYGTAGTAALGVLGETPPDRMHQRLRRAGRAFARPGRPVLPVYELIVTVADRSPGRDGDYAHDIARADVRRYVEAARRNGALVLLDIQPGRGGFLDAARRWRWALEEPHVGLALDPEWRMHGTVPGSVIGSVSADEVNRTAAWLSRLVQRHGLHEKLFVLHQFRASMIEDIERIIPRANLAMVQHVDGFGTPGQKRATYDAVARPRQFTMGFKLFYDEDVHRMGPAAVHGLRPDVRFVSFQ